MKGWTRFARALLPSDLRSESCEDYDSSHTLKFSTVKHHRPCAQMATASLTVTPAEDIVFPSIDVNEMFSWLPKHLSMNRNSCVTVFSLRFAQRGAFVLCSTLLTSDVCLQREYITIIFRLCRKLGCVCGQTRVFGFGELNPCCDSSKHSECERGISKLAPVC